MNRREFLIRAGQLAASSVVAPAALLAAPSAASYVTAGELSAYLECPRLYWYCKRDVELCGDFLRGSRLMRNNARHYLGEAVT